jgi:hypothetical protein
MTSNGRLLDDVLPKYDVHAEYSVKIHSTPERVYNILRQGLPVGAITRLLMAIRNIPRKMSGQTSDRAENAFYTLKQVENREIIVGIIGQFWKPVANPLPIQSLEEFQEFNKNGYCKAAMNLKIIQQAPYLCVVTTETRVQCFGSAREHFLEYWRVIGPFSGLIRKEVLRKIKKRAETR